MKLKPLIAAGVAALAAIGGTTAMAQHRDNATRIQLDRIDNWVRDLIPFASDHLRNAANYDDRRLDTRRGQEEIRTMMAVGAFSGELHAFHMTWDRFPDASLGGAISDLDESYRSADRSMRYFRGDGEVMRRWIGIRNAYDRLHQDLQYGGPDLGQGYRPGDDGYDNGYRGRGGDSGPNIIIH